MELCDNSIWSGYRPWADSTIRPLWKTCGSAMASYRFPPYYIPTCPGPSPLLFDAGSASSSALSAKLEPAALATNRLAVSHSGGEEGILVQYLLTPHKNSCQEDARWCFKASPPPFPWRFSTSRDWCSNARGRRDLKKHNIACLTSAPSLPSLTAQYCSRSGFFHWWQSLFVALVLSLTMRHQCWKQFSKRQSPSTSGKAEETVVFPSTCRLYSRSALLCRRHQV